MAQPVLGILALYINEQKQLEERHIYQKMIVAGKKLGLDVFVFTPQDVRDQPKRIYALTYQPSTKRWSRKWVPFPHMIFDRCRIQNTYRFEQLKRFRSKYRHLLFLNRPLRNKWTIYQVLSEVPAFEPYLPKTKLYSSIKEVQRMLKEHELIYLKPINGTGGRGILRLERLKSSKQLVYVQGRDQLRRIINPQRMSWNQLRAKMSAWNAKGRYLTQQGIALRLASGRVHDYRMLVQKDGTGTWTVTGCAGRVGAAKSITSNLHGGGAAVRMEALLRQWIGDEQKMLQVKEDAERLGVEVAKFLEQRYGALCELALDLAIDRCGHVWLLEVNPKPAREVFAKSGDKDTYALAIQRPLEYAKWLYEHQNSTKQESRASELRGHTSHEADSPAAPPHERLTLSALPADREPVEMASLLEEPPASLSSKLKPSRGSAKRPSKPFFPTLPQHPRRSSKTVDIAERRSQRSQVLDEEELQEPLLSDFDELRELDMQREEERRQQEKEQETKQLIELIQSFEKRMKSGS